MSANRKAALALAAWLAVLPGFAVAEGYTEGNAANRQEEQAAQENEVQAEAGGGKPVEEDGKQPEPQKEEKQNEDKPGEDKPSEGKPSEDKPSEDKPSEGKPSEDKPSEDKPKEEKPSEEKQAEAKPTVETTEQPAATPVEEKQTEEQPTEQPTAEPTEAPAETPDGQKPGAEPTQEAENGGQTPAPAETGDTPLPEPQTTNPPADMLPADVTESPRPVVVTTPEPEDDSWKQAGQVWVDLGEGKHAAGSLEAVLSWLEENLGEDEGATVYIRTRDVLTADNVSRNLLSRVGFEPDGESDSFNTEKYEYVAVLDSKDLMTLEETGDMEDVRFSISVQVLRADELNKTESPGTGETQTPGTNETQAPGTNETQAPGTGETQTPSAQPSATPAPTEEPTPTPKPVIEVAAEDYEPGVWKNSAPSFTLSGIPEGSDEYVYGVFICDERLILLSNGNNMYMPDEEGLISVRFVILDKMGDVQSLSDQYDMMLDFTPPDGPYLMEDEENRKICHVEVYDGLSGLDSISYDGGQTWLSCNDPENDNLTRSGEKGDKLEAGKVWARDFAGNISVNEEEFVFGKRKTTGSGTGTGTKPIRHVKETMDYSKANYNALELNVSDQPQTELTIGGTELSLSLTGEDGVQPFTAELTTWLTTEGEKKTQPNTLVLTAAKEQADEQADEPVNVWRFGGETYKLLYNSGVEYLVFASGDYITVIPTEGFTGGTQYGKLKAGGVSTRKFEYTLIQDEELRETTLSVQVEGETYLLEESTESPMYRYNVLVGTKDMMQKPYESYMPGKEAI